MPNLKIILLGLVASLSLSAILSAPASASAAVETRFFVEGKEVSGSEEFTIDGVLGVTQLNSEIANIKVMVECTATTFIQSQIKANGEASSTPEFNNCSIYTIKKGARAVMTNCTIPERIAFSAKEQLIDGPGGVAELEIKPKTGTTFTTVEISGKECMLEGKYEVTGTLRMAAPEAEVARSDHALIANSTGSGVSMAKEKASVTILGQRVRVRGASNYSA
jgi:hypothetical protein